MIAMNGLPRVNGSMLANNVGNLVCLVGKITQVSPTGNALKLLTSDQQTVNVNMREQYEDTAGNCIQIIGTVQQNQSVVAEKYINFSGDNEFDFNLYEKAINLLPRYSQLFKTAGSNAKDENNMDDW